MDVIVVGMQEHSGEFWSVVLSCSPLRSGREHVELVEKLEQRKRLDRHDFEELVDRGRFLQVLGTFELFHALRLHV